MNKDINIWDGWGGESVIIIPIDTFPPPPAALPILMNAFIVIGSFFCQRFRHLCLFAAPHFESHFIHGIWYTYMVYKHQRSLYM